MLRAGLLLLLGLGPVQAQTGTPAYVDESFSCPLISSCPAICVADVTDCPPDLTCLPDETLCDDGSCVSTDEGCPPDLYGPCIENVCNNTVTCAIPVIEFDMCQVVFEQEYTDAEMCDAADYESALVSWTSPAFVVGYCWISIVSVLIFCWCAYNQRLSPIGTALPLDDFSKANARRKSSYPALEIEQGEEGENSRIWTQTAYKKTIIGTTLYALTIATFWAFQVLLAILVKWFYDQQWERETLNPFEDEVQVLSVFVVVWLIGFVWSLHIKWPASIRSLFYRRCLFDEADFVAVWAPANQQVNESTKHNKHIQRIRRCMDCILGVLNSYLSFLFSDVTRPDHRGSFKFCPVAKNSDGTHSFTFRLRQYNLDPSKEVFFRPGRMAVGTSLEDFHRGMDGLTTEEVKERVARVGKNKIHMKKPYLIVTILEEYNQFFYLYQIYITWTWLNFWYYHVGLIYVGTYVIGGLVVATLKYREQRDLYKLSQVSGDVQVLRDGKVCTKPQEELVPGDVIRLASGIPSCDMVILRGNNIIVDESALTGEVSPVSKTQIDAVSEGKALYDMKTHKRHSIFAGTEIVECRDALAIVTKVGSFSTKGELLRDILYYERHRFKFDVQIEIVLGILVVWALVAFGITIRLLGGISENTVYTFFYGAYVAASVIPPLLPTVFVVSVSISNRRLLHERRIACSESRAILVAGKVSVAFFDKTGTLTNQGLDFMATQSYKVGKLCSDSQSSALTEAMATCHTLVKSEKGDIIGNHVDACMFEASRASMESSDSEKSGSVKMCTPDGKELTVVKRFDFDHERMTQSVLVQDNKNGHMTAFVKGSAESIKKLCRPDTLPADFDESTKLSAKSGIYQISIAMRSDDIAFSDLSNTSRDDVETELEFIGFVNFKNTLREETPGVLKELEEGAVRSVMVTGDSIHTGVCMAKESGLIDPEKQVLLGQLDDRGAVQWTDAATDESVFLPSIKQLEGSENSAELALTGEAWSAILARSQEEAIRLAHHVKVYGRCSPNDKVSVVATCVKEGAITLMCGDGGNDCGALKTAHVGIALSDAEASIVAPFTSLDKEITSVLDVLKEGRCALASALKVYKYELMYGQITTFNQMANAYFAITFDEWNWVFMDAIWMMTMAFTLPRARAAKKLSPARPTASLLGAHTMSSFMGILLINFLAMVVGLVALNQQDWYQCRKWLDSDVSNALVIGDNYESTVIWLITGYQYISSAMAYNFGFTHRAPWWSNYRFVFFAIGFSVLHYVVTLTEGRLSCLFRVNCTNENVVRPVIGDEPLPINNDWNTTVMPVPFRWIIVGIMTANLLLNLIYEYYVVNGLQKKISQRLRDKEGKAENEKSQLKVTPSLPEASFDNEVVKVGDDAAV